MNIIDQIRQEWLALGHPHVPYKTHEEVEREKNSNLIWAARVQEQAGRPLSDRELFDMQA